MDYKRLRLLVDVLDAGGIAKCAAVRGQPQSWVSGRIDVAMNRRPLKPSSALPHRLP